jgi:predicted nucleic acid-binding protein
MRKSIAWDDAVVKVDALMGFLDIIGIDGKDIREATRQGIHDLEDGLLLRCCKKKELDVIATRDKELLKLFPQICKSPEDMVTAGLLGLE